MQRYFKATANSALPAMAIVMSRQSRLWHLLNAYTSRPGRNHVLHIARHTRFSTSRHLSDRQKCMQTPFGFKGLPPRRFGPSQFQNQAFENGVQGDKQTPGSHYKEKLQWKMSSLLDILPGILLGGVLGTIFMPKKPVAPQKTQEEERPDTTRQQKDEEGKKEELKVTMGSECEEQYTNYHSNSVVCGGCEKRAKMDGENYKEYRTCTTPYCVYYDGATDCEKGRN